MIVCDAAATAARLPYAALVEAVADVLRAKVAGTARAPERLVVRLRPQDPQGGSLLCMPAADADVAVTKLITVHAGNRRHGLPVIQGEMTVMRADTGDRLLLLDGATVTARRTAAASVLAMRTLRPPEGCSPAGRPYGPVLVMGAGVQAAAHVAACREVLGVEQIVLYARSAASGASPASGAGLVQDARAQGLAVDVISHPEALPAALARCPVIITATTSPVPVLPDAPELLRDDACIVAVGSFHADQAEIPASIMRRARVVVDSLEAARHEAGDILLAGLDWADIPALEHLLEAPPAYAPGPVVYKSVGCAYFDLAAGRVAAGMA